jgi:hypothetical protein
MSYRGRKITAYWAKDSEGLYWNAAVDGVPAVCYAMTEEQAYAIAKMIVDGSGL